MSLIVMHNFETSHLGYKINTIIVNSDTTKVISALLSLFDVNYVFYCVNFNLRIFFKPENIV